MEGLTRLVSESLARHGFDRPLDYRRLQWSRWFRCDSHHSLLFVPSKPGVFALAEEILDICSTTNREGHDFSSADTAAQQSAALPAEGRAVVDGQCRRMLAVAQFLEADDMAFVLDRMLSRPNPMRTRLESGCYFVRFVVIEDSAQRRSICSALNQWMLSTAEKASGIGSHFASSLELTSATEHVGRTLLSANVEVATSPKTGMQSNAPIAVTRPNSGAMVNIHHPPPFPSGF